MELQKLKIWRSDSKMLKRYLIGFGIPALILWRGSDALTRIQNAFDEACAVLEERGGSCASISTDMEFLHWVMLIAAAATFFAYLFWCAYSDAWDREHPQRVDPRNV